jgi:ATP-binding cassette subfamily B protein
MNWGALRRALGYLLKPYGGLMAIAFVSLLLGSAASLISPKLIERAIDDGIVPRNMNAILIAVTGLLIVAVIKGVFTFLQNFVSEKASQNMAYDLRNEIFNKITEMGFSFYDKQQTGQLMTRVTSDVDTLRQFIGQGFLQLIGALITLIVVAIVLFATNWQLALVEVLSIPIIFALLGFFIQRVRPLFMAAQAKLGALNTILQENLAGIRVVRSFAREPHEVQRYTGINQELADVNIDVTRKFSINFPAIFMVVNVTTLLVVLVGGFQVIGNTLKVGELVAFNSYLAVLIQPIFAFGFLSSFISRAAVSAERVFEVLDAKSDVIEKPDAKTLPAVQGRVEFKNVTFKFAGAEQPVLSSIDLLAEPGQTIAIMGKTGSGKSSIINLIPRFYDPNAGQILIDGHDVKDVTLDSLRGAIGIVLQDNILFSGSIRDNIAYGKPDATMDDVLAAARAAQADAFITAMPDGYNTVVGERGVGLSGGQKQRVAIARALLIDPRILILDDSTSAVDAETEYQIQQALDKLMKNRTTFVIAQRISTVRDADKIVLLDNGRVIAQGAHEELLASSSLYGEIIDSQFKDDTKKAVSGKL